MKLQHVEIINSPESKDKVRLVGEVVYDKSVTKTEHYWFEVSREHASLLSQTGNPWLTCLLPLAVTLGEPLRINLPVDRVLFENVHKLMHVWKGWYPHLHVIPIEAEVSESPKRRARGKTASLFSLGVDAFFSVLKYDEDAVSSSEGLIDDLIFIGGFDKILEEPEAFERLQQVASQAASELGKRLIVISTNLRYTRFKEADYSDLSQASILASAIHALEGFGYTDVLLPSGYDYKALHPHGSHPQTDPLYSTDLTKIIHHGTEFNRVEKTKFIAQSEIALRTLRPCWPLPAGENCGICSKCLRTMATLDVLGVLDKCTAFGEAKLNLEALSTVPMVKHSAVFYQEIKSFAEKEGRTDIADAVECGLQLASYEPYLWARKMAYTVKRKGVIGKWILMPLTPLIKKAFRFGHKHLRRFLT